MSLPAHRTMRSTFRRTMLVAACLLCMACRDRKPDQQASTVSAAHAGSHILQQALIGESTEEKAFQAMIRNIYRRMLE